MRFSSIATAAICFVGLLGSVRGATAAETQQVSGPVVHENLAVYFIHGASANGPVPLTLDEALSNGSVKVVETGEVNELKIENTGGEPVFIQSGDIVKGGRQDRTLTTSLILPPHSGESRSPHSASSMAVGASADPKTLRPLRVPLRPYRRARSSSR